MKLKPEFLVLFRTHNIIMSQVENKVKIHGESMIKVS